jgi:hypothetical protein
MRMPASRAAGVAATTGLAAIASFQIALAVGAPWGRAAWGGTYIQLPAGLRAASAVSAVILALAAIAVFARADYRRPAPAPDVARWGTWALVPRLALNALGNFASSSKWENFLMGPLALLLSALCLVVARSPADPTRTLVEP